MDDIAGLSECVRQLQNRLTKYTGLSLNEAQTRKTFIDPLLTTLGWDVADPELVDNEHKTIDGKAVDYAMKIHGKAALLVEAKSLDDSLTDVKAVTQVVGYASNEGVEWCALTNGATYKVYCSTEKAFAPDKLVFEVCIDSRSSAYTSLGEVVGQLRQISRQGMQDGVLGRVFARDKVRKALDKLLLDPPAKLVSIVKAATGDGSINGSQVKEALRDLWPRGSQGLPPRQPTPARDVRVDQIPESAGPEYPPHAGAMRHPPVKSVDGATLASSPHDFAVNHKPRLKYEGMRCAIDSLTACMSPEGDNYGFHYEVDYRQDGVYVERKEGPGYRTSQGEQDEMRMKVGLPVNPRKRDGGAQRTPSDRMIDVLKR